MDHKKIKILAIDDNKDNLIVLKALIMDAFPDAQYISAENGKDGFELCQAEKPDVILLDIVMPGMDGYEVCRKLKADQRLKHIPVVMVTANRTDKASRVIALEAGADAFLPKPVDDSELKAQIKAMLRIKASEDQKITEQQRLEDMVLDRTEALEKELADRIKAEDKLVKSLDKITKNKQAIMNLMEDLKCEIKQRKQTEENLEAERDLLMKLINNIPDPISLKDTEGRYLLDNKSHLDLIGADNLNEVIGKTSFDFFSEEDASDFHNVEKKLILSGEAVISREEKIISKRTCEMTWHLTSKIPLSDSTGKTVKILTISHDITERKKAEDKLKESEERFRQLIENQGEGVGIVDLKEEFVFANPAAEEMFGLGNGELMHRSLLEFVHPDDISIINQETKKRSKSEKSTYEIDIIRPNGERRTILITATPQFGIDGRLSGTFGVFRDITDRKKLENKIIESEAYYRTLIDISPDGILIADLEGNVAYCSIKANEIFGVPPEHKVIGTSILNWVSPDYQQIAMDRISDILYGNIAPETREYKLRKYDGSIFWGELSSSPLSDMQGNSNSLMIICRDISERKRAEDELIKAKDKAEESDRLKTAFLHNISHEIRTPMNAIIGFSALLNEPGVDSDTQKSFLEIINNSSNHLLSIVSDIIEISNVEAGLLKLKQDKVNLNSILQNLNTIFDLKAAEKGIKLNLKDTLPETVANIETDVTKITQIISNLLGNAFKFTTRGKIEFGCKFKNDLLEFYVSDTGIGLSPDQFDKIFDRFYQVENSVSRQYEGTGLGLSISKAYVELVGGRMWVASEKGSGSTFYFTVPYIISDKIERTESQANNIKKPEKISKKAILIAEDEDTNYLLMVELLSSLNTKLIRAENGKAAVDVCKAEKEIGLVLMDIKMPVMDGHTATMEIRKFNTEIPVIALTAFAFEADREKAIKSGCTDYLSKPVKKSVLLEMVKKYL